MASGRCASVGFEKSRYPRTLFAVLWIALFISGCDSNDPQHGGSNTDSTDRSRDQIPEVNRASVEKLCGHCHLFPEPKWLTQTAWRDSIIDMTKLNDFTLFYPDRPSTEDVIDWYVRRAPKEPVAPQGVSMEEIDTGRFTQSKIPLISDGAEPAVISSLRSFSLLPSKSIRQILVGDMKSGQILLRENDSPGTDPFREIGKLNHPARLNAVDLDKDGLTDLLVSELGSFLPLDHDLGAVIWLRQAAPGEFKSIVLCDRLGRVADVQAADFDNDGDLDLVVAEFGWHLTGHVILFENQTQDWSEPRFQKRILDGRHGAVRISCLDLNGDGREDFVALIAQGHEMLVAYLNQGEMRFEAKILHRAPHPAWGYCALEAVDLDGDGDIDFILGNGDTLDNSELKPYYEIAWLENRGDLKFDYHSLTEMFGVMALEAGDLDGDGDLDIAAAAFTASEVQTGSRQLTLPSILWLEQKSGGTFERHVLEADRLVHLSLTIADVDGDGRNDILVGSGRFLETGAKETFIEIWRGISDSSK